MSEPIEERGELNEAEKGGGKFFVAGADAVTRLRPAKRKPK